MNYIAMACELLYRQARSRVSLRLYTLILLPGKGFIAGIHLSGD